MVEEIPVVFSCHSEQLIGMIHQPVQVIRQGVLIVVGGPQYRAGSHRQFVLLARMLADNGVPVMRFDYRGMGDSQGQSRTFLEVNDDIKSAVDVFYQHSPNLEGVVIWGLCDAASAACFYAYQDKRIQGLILLNPWVYTEQGAAKTFLKYYYFQRLINPDLWRKIFSLQFNYQQSLSSFVELIKRLFVANDKPLDASSCKEDTLVDSQLALPQRVLRCLERFDSPVLFILSAKDLTADEFREQVNIDPEWQRLFEKLDVSRIELKEADHTFSSQKWRDEVAELSLKWVKEDIG